MFSFYTWMQHACLICIYLRYHSHIFDYIGSDYVYLMTRRRVQTDVW